MHYWNICIYIRNVFDQEFLGLVYILALFVLPVCTLESLESCRSLELYFCDLKILQLRPCYLISLIPISFCPVEAKLFLCDILKAPK
jgi:hypothetical protein